MRLINTGAARRILKQAVQQGRSKQRADAYRRYVEALSVAKTSLVACSAPCS